MNELTIVVIDDHPMFRQGVVDTLRIEPDFSIIGEAANGEDGLNLIRSLHPSIAVVDVNLPGINGQQVTRQVTSEKLPTKIVLLTAYDDIEQKLNAMVGGASAYCVKDIEPEALVRAIHNVISGKIVVGNEVMDHSRLGKWISLHIESAVKSYSDPGESFQPLSRREMEVLTYITRGQSNKEIASSLGISHQTVKNHVTAILRKLSVEDRTQAALYALRRGWVRLYQQDKALQE